MSGIATAVVGGAVISGGLSYLSSKDSADAAEEAADTQAGAEREALEYLKEREAVPQALREEALGKLGGIYGLTGMGGGGGTPGGETTGGTYGTEPPPAGGEQNLIQEYADLQKKLAETQYINDNMTEKMRDNQGLKNTSQMEQRLDEIRRTNPTVVFPPMPVAGYGGHVPDADLSDYIGNYATNTGAPGGTPGTPGGGGVAGTDGATAGEGFGQQSLIDQAMNSPLYQSMMGGQEMGEEAIMRNAGATGGLRSGNVQGNMYDYVTQLQNSALLSSYNEQLQGLQGLAGLPSNANQIAGGIAGIGQTQAQGITAGAQATATGNQSMMNNLLGTGSLATSMYSAGMFSDKRLKRNIKLIGEVNGFNFYSFDWNSIANKLGLNGSTCGCMADEVYKEVPEAVILKNDFMFVNYSVIGVL